METTLDTLRRFVAPASTAGNEVDDVVWEAMSGWENVTEKQVTEYIMAMGWAGSNPNSARTKAGRILKRLLRDGKAKKVGYGSYEISVHPDAPPEPTDEDSTARTAIQPTGPYAVVKTDAAA